MHNVKAIGLPVARGVALFFGSFSLVNAVAALRGSGAAADMWWVDLSMLPGWLAFVLSAAAAAMLVAYAVAPTLSQWRRIATALSAAALGSAACWNAAGFYDAWHAGRIAPLVSVPLSVLIAVVLGLVGLAAWLQPAPIGGRGAVAGVALTLLAMLALFPLGQVFFFGTTDYRRPADVAVILGAKVHDDGTLSTSLWDRVRTGVHLYDAGLVHGLVMSGGVGTNGVDEARAMRDAAVRAGVPAEVIQLDDEGIDTDATVANTGAMFRSDGTNRILVVSQFYHLPRIKLAYRAAGIDALTVPAETSWPIAKTPQFVAREIPAFWLYWARAVTRDGARGPSQ